MIHPNIILAIKQRHAENCSDPIYMEGFNAKRTDKNPYKFPDKTGNSRIMAALKPCLTQKQKNNLIMWNKRFEKTKWARWSNGFHAVQRVQSVS